ncbi:MAG: hypothetical protein MUF49_10255 [Oculatellaceae cyanobacterium Prado106]|jgi:hypothetical protein|nr:hypothetical protein [Oculatellaceae cyanobacterium Prado106]
MMNGAVLPNTNGSKPPTAAIDSHQTVRQFFSRINWDDAPAEVQELKQQATETPTREPLSLHLTVRQFFGAINWDGMDAIAPTPDPTPTFIENLPDDPPAPPNDGFTLDDFTGLF